MVDPQAPVGGGDVKRPLRGKYQNPSAVEGRARTAATNSKPFMTGM